MATRQPPSQLVFFSLLNGVIPTRQAFERLRVQDVEEAGRPAAMLNVGLADGVGGSEEDAGLPQDELGQVGA